MSRLTMTVSEAGAALGVSRNTAYGLVKKGEIPVLKLGGRLLVPRDAVLKMLAKASGEHV